jgi:hypothetical protein
MSEENKFKEKRKKKYHKNTGPKKGIMYIDLTVWSVERSKVVIHRFEKKEFRSSENRTASSSIRSIKLKSN